VTYYLNGAPDVFNIPGYTLTYGLNTNGRLNTAVRGSNTLVSGVTYGPLGPTQVLIGTGTDADDYVYDSNTGNMKQYQFFVGATASYKGVLSWNANGSLSSTAITDGFNSGNTQTCTYTHDDVARLTGDNCGSNWSQTFSYDQYDNLTKAGSATFNPGYNTKNQYTGIGATYDAAGNLTYDGTNTITWDGFGKMLTFASTTFVYDAFGNAVRNSAGKDILYGPLGKIGVITYPSTYGNTYLPLPGGGTWSMQNAHYAHRDFLGTSAVVSTVPASGDGLVASDLMYAPYGDQFDSHGTVSPVMFAGNPSDLNSSLYDTPNRELSVVGRWESVDPAHSSWNGYAYVTDPTVQNDTTGLSPQDPNTGVTSSGDPAGSTKCDPSGNCIWTIHKDVCDASCKLNRALGEMMYAETHSHNPNGFMSDTWVARAWNKALRILFPPQKTFCWSGRCTPMLRDMVMPVGGFGASAEGGVGAIAGHGIESALAGTTTVPLGTTIMIPGQPGLMLSESMGQAMEAGNLTGASALKGSTTYLPGAEIPNLILQAPDAGMTTLPTSITVTEDTPLSQILQPGMGNVCWAACRIVP